MFIIQEARGGKEWKAYNYEEYTFLDQAYLVAEDLDTYGGKYEYRIIDEIGNVYYHRVDPYEGVSIDLSKIDWLEDIRDDYGVDANLWKQACQYWLEFNV